MRSENVVYIMSKHGVSIARGWTDEACREAVQDNITKEEVVGAFWYKERERGNALTKQSRLIEAQTQSPVASGAPSE